MSLHDLQGDAKHRSNRNFQVTGLLQGSGSYLHLNMHQDYTDKLK